MNKKQLDKLNTINVIESIDGSISQLISFNDNEKGNIEAEKKFLNILENLSYSFNDNEKQSILEDGFFNDESGYLLSLVHSN